MLYTTRSRQSSEAMPEGSECSGRTWYCDDRNNVATVRGLGARLSGWLYSAGIGYVQYVPLSIKEFTSCNYSCMINLCVTNQ